MRKSVRFFAVIFGWLLLSVSAYADIGTHIKEHTILGVVKNNASATVGAPAWASWTSDTFNGIDIHAFVDNVHPTVFFDPGASTSQRRGTFNNPYTTGADVNAWINSRGGNMAGQVLGIKRGSRLLGGWSTTAVYGSSTAPFYIIPYGDGTAMPIISGGTVYAAHASDPAIGWVTVTGSSGLIFKKTLASEADVFDQSYSAVIKRYYKQSTGGVASEANVVTNLLAAGVGTSMYYSGTLYVYPFAGTPDWTQVEVMRADNALALFISDVANTGYVTVAGINVRGARNTAFGINAGGVTNASTGISVIGCKIGQGGYDNSANNGGSDGLYVYGPNDTNRSGGLKIIGNYIYDNQNNSIELGNISSADIHHNTLLNSHGKALELYLSTSLVLFHDNYATGEYGGHTPLTSFGNEAIRTYGFITTDVVNTYASSNTGNEYYRNVLLNFKGGVTHKGAAGKLYNNTIYAKTNAGGDGYSINVTNTTNGTNALEIKNNLLIGTGTSGNCGMIITGNAVTVYSESNAEYLPGGTYMNYHLGTTYTSIATYNAAADTKTITAGSWSGGTATVTVASTAGLLVGETVTIASVNPTGFNSTNSLITGLTGTTVSYAVVSNPGAWVSGGTVTQPNITINPLLAADGYTPTAAGIFNAATPIPGGYTVLDWIGRNYLNNGSDVLPAYGAVARP